MSSCGALQWKEAEPQGRSPSRAVWSLWASGVHPTVGAPPHHGLARPRQQPDSARVKSRHQLLLGLGPVAAALWALTPKLGNQPSWKGAAKDPDLLQSLGTKVEDLLTARRPRPRRAQEALEASMEGTLVAADSGRGRREGRRQPGWSSREGWRNREKEKLAELSKIPGAITPQGQILV